MEHTSDTDVIDSPSGWVADHITEYVESGGEQGHHWNGTTTLLLTVTGRSSGLRRRTALIYVPDGDSYVVVASAGGAPDHPEWYKNLVANPDVEVQVGPEVFHAKARTADADERARLWPDLTAVWPDYDEYQKKTDREIPLVVLDPVG